MNVQREGQNDTLGPTVTDLYFRLSGAKISCNDPRNEPESPGSASHAIKDTVRVVPRKRKLNYQTHLRDTYSVPLGAAEVEYYREYPNQLRDRRKFERWIMEAELTDNDCEDQACGNCGLCKALQPGKRYKRKSPPP